MSAPKRPTDGRGGIAFALFLAASLAATLLPFAWMALESLAPPLSGGGGAARYLPARWSTAHYATLASLGDIPRFIMNSLIYAAGLTALSLLLNALAAYAFARVEFPRRDRLFTLLVLTMMVPSQVTLIPVFLILRGLGLLNSHLGLILPGAAHVYGMLMVRNALRDLPDELFEAARIDGCSEWQIFRRIALPLARPILATLAVTSFVNTWNEFLLPLVVMQDEPMFTLPVALAAINAQSYGRWGPMMAGAVIAALPSFLVFLAAQRHYLRGLTQGHGR